MYGGGSGTIVPIDVLTHFAAQLPCLSGMELGHVLQVIDLTCSMALQDPTEDHGRMPQHQHQCYPIDTCGMNLMEDVKLKLMLSPLKHYGSLIGMLKKVNERGVMI